MLNSPYGNFLYLEKGKEMNTCIHMYVYINLSKGKRILDNGPRQMSKQVGKCKLQKQQQHFKGV